MALIGGLFAFIAVASIWHTWSTGAFALTRFQDRLARTDNARIISDPNNCVSDCVENEYMSVLLEPNNRQDCKIERDFIRCLEACPRSELRDIVFTSRTVAKMICMDDYEEYKKHRACIQSAATDDSPNATVQECPANGDEQILDFIADPFAPSGIRYESDPDAVQQNLTKICNNYECNARFNQDGFRNQCGKAASDLWLKFLKVRVKSAIDVYNFFKVVKGTVPECDALFKINN